MAARHRYDVCGTTADMREVEWPSAIGGSMRGIQPASNDCGRDGSTCVDIWLSHSPLCDGDITHRSDIYSLFGFQSALNAVDGRQIVDEIFSSDIICMHIKWVFSILETFTCLRLSGRIHGKDQYGRQPHYEVVDDENNISCLSKLSTHFIVHFIYLQSDLKTRCSQCCAKKVWIGHFGLRPLEFNTQNRTHPFLVATSDGRIWSIILIFFMVNRLNFVK